MRAQDSSSTAMDWSLEPAALLARAIEAALSAAQTLEGDAALARYQKLHGRSLAITLRGLGLSLHFSADAEGRLHVHSVSAGEPAVQITAAPFSLLRVLQSKDPARLFTPEIQLQGDSRTAQAWTSALQSSDIDWEEHLSHLTGDFIARPLGVAARGLRDWLQKSRATIHADVGEFMREEARLFPDRWEVDEFVAGVDALRARLDRAEARWAYAQRAARDKDAE
jgi:ubiquinone biosynthesis protein UbiJ